MQKIKELYKKIIEKYGITKEKQKYIIFFIFVFIASATLGNKLTPLLNGMSILLISFAFTIIILLTSGLAVITFFRSLVVIGAGLSILSFLASEYCNTPMQFQTANDALKSILIFGGLYLLGLFIKSLKRELLGHKDGKDELGKKGAIVILKEANGGKNSILFVFFYALFLGSFISQLYMVIFSIYSGLCIFR